MTRAPKPTAAKPIGQFLREVEENEKRWTRSTAAERCNHRGAVVLFCSACMSARAPGKRTKGRGKR